MALTGIVVGIQSGQTKDQAFVTSTITPPEAKIIAIGFDGVDSSRKLEIQQSIKQLRDVIIESGVFFEGSSKIAQMPIGGIKGDAFILPAMRTAPDSGNVFIQVDSAYPCIADNLGNGIFYADIATLINALNDFYLKGT